jgi:hypothetical protein
VSDVDGRKYSADFVYFKDDEHVAEMLSSMQELASDAEQEGIIGRLRQRLRRRKDAATLLTLEDIVEETELLFLQPELSLSNTASDFWNELTDYFGRKKTDKTIKLEIAGERLGKAWRRDTDRAVLALQRTPEKLQTEVRRQRLARLKPELKILGLHRRRLGKLTVQDAHAAHIKQAKELHPDSQFSKQRGGLLHGLFRKAPTADEAHKSHKGMIELNKAYEKVKRAITAPVTDWKANLNIDPQKRIF